MNFSIILLFFCVYMVVLRQSNKHAKIRIKCALASADIAFSFRRASPLTPWLGARLLDPAGGKASRPRYINSRSRARRGLAPPLPNPKHATAVMQWRMWRWWWQHVPGDTRSIGNSHATWSLWYWLHIRKDIDLWVSIKRCCHTQQWANTTMH